MSVFPRIADNPGERRFLVPRRAFTDQVVFEREKPLSFIRGEAGTIATAYDDEV